MIWLLGRREDCWMWKNGEEKKENSKASMNRKESKIQKKTKKKPRWTIWLS